MAITIRTNKLIQNSICIIISLLSFCCKSSCLIRKGHFARKAMSSSSFAANNKKPAITFVTGNKNKLAEVQRILSLNSDDDAVENFPFKIVNQKVDLPELQGDPNTIAVEKCRLAANKIQGPCFTEDTSLCFNALNGMPGPYIKWFLEKCGHDGLNKMLVGFEDKSAYALTVIAYSSGGENDNIEIFEGRTEGLIVPPRGPLDFGWDPIFEPTEGGQDGLPGGSGETYAEMNKDQKNAISHRGKAFAKLRTFLRNKAKDCA